MMFERIEPPGPVRSIRLQPRVEFHQRFSTKSIETPLGIPSDLHQPGITKHLEMTRHTRLMHPDLLDQVVHRALRLANRVENPPPRRLGDHFQHLESSRQEHSIRLDIYMCKQMDLEYDAYVPDLLTGWDRSVPELPAA